MTDQTARPSPDEVSDATQPPSGTAPTQKPDAPTVESSSALGEAIDRATAAVGEDDGKR